LNRGVRLRLQRVRLRLLLGTQLTLLGDFLLFLRTLRSRQLLDRKSVV
jgi:hypothetical protein